MECQIEKPGKYDLTYTELYKNYQRKKQRERNMSDCEKCFPFGKRSICGRAMEAQICSLIFLCSFAFFYKISVTCIIKEQEKAKKIQKTKSSVFKQGKHQGGINQKGSKPWLGQASPTIHVLNAWFQPGAVGGGSTFKRQSLMGSVQITEHVPFRVL